MAMTNNPESIGERLKKVRLEKGISLDEAHRITKVHLDVLKAIEDDNYININPVYLKGFLKIYCKFLDVELPASFLEKKHTQVHLPRQQEVRFERIQRSPSLGQESQRDRDGKRFERIQRAPALEAAREKAEKKAERPAGGRDTAPARPLFPPDLVRKAVAVCLVCVCVVAASAILMAAGRSIAKKFAQGAGSRHAQAVKTTKVKIARKAAAKASAVSGAIPKDEDLRLGVRALEDCWLQLKADNKVVFQNVLKKGRFESWEAKDRMDLVLGSAGGVQIEINGKLIPSLGKRGQVLKNVQITRNNGLQVGK
jgi:cytoskeleton protein RodZ